MYLNPTNVTLSWDVTTAYVDSAWANVTFGTSTTYAFYAANESGLGRDVYINYLEPSTTYYYKIAAYGYCLATPYHWYHGTLTGSFSTTAATVWTYHPQYLSGQVLNSTGSAGATGMLVIAYCSDWMGTWDDMIYNYSGATSAVSRYWWQSATVGADGYFAIQVSAEGQDDGVGNDTYAEVCDWGGSTTVVSIFTSTSERCGYLGVCVSGGAWGGLGTWNETFVVWDRPYIDVEAPTNGLGPYVPLELEYTNSSYATLQFNESVSVTATYTATIAGNGGSTSSSFVQSISGSATGENVETWARYYCSGWATFNATTRSSSLSYVSFFGAIYDSTTQNLISGVPLSPSSITRSEAFGDGLWYWFNITHSETRAGGVTVTGSVTDVSGLDITLDVSFDLGGVVSIGASIPITVEFSTTTSYSDALYFSVYNTGSTTHAFTAYVQGGSTTTSGLILYLWQMD